MNRRAVLAVVTVAAAAGFAHAALTTEVPPACHVVNVTEDTTDDTLAILWSQGYTGDPRDHAERLYSPSCPNAASAALIIEQHNRETR